MPRFDDSILRMIDANLNRCREGVRVLEDCARFGIDDAPIAQRLKSARHALRTATQSLPVNVDELISSRDTAGDVGTMISTDTEHKRSGMRDLVLAAGKRASESLRVIEESTKTIGANANAFESIRYQLYDIERDLILALHPQCPQWALCVLITEKLCTHHTPEQVVECAAAGGAGCIQIREKTMPDAQLLDHTGKLTQLAHELGMHVMINDRVQIAKLVGADGVHLGQDDLPIAAARELLGPRMWIGRTCPTNEQAIEAIDQGADTCGLGPVFASSTKSKPSLAGIKLIQDYLNDPRARTTPLLAISGITPTNVDQLSAIGCPGVAVSSAVCSSDDPQSAARSIVESIGACADLRSATIKA
jgi:thiamine-phosphate pyrophosphorylase